MSSVQWDHNRLIQRVGDEVEELGYLGKEPNRPVWVIWLKDTRGVFGGSSYVRGDEYPSEKAAKERGAFSTAVFLFHMMWMYGLRENASSTGDNQSDIENALAQINIRGDRNTIVVQSPSAVLGGREEGK